MGIRPVDSPHKGPVTRKIFPIDDVIMGAQERLLGIFLSQHWFRELTMEGVYYVARQNQLMTNIILLIMLTSYVLYGIFNHPPLGCLFKSLFRLTSKSVKTPHYWTFARRIHRWPMDSPHKEPVMQKTVRSHYANIIKMCSVTWKKKITV